MNGPLRTVPFGVERRLQMLEEAWAEVGRMHAAGVARSSITAFGRLAVTLAWVAESFDALCVDQWATAHAYAERIAYLEGRLLAPDDGHG